eukprot:2616634-Rhodomonas_salina.2
MPSFFRGGNQPQQQSQAGPPQPSPQAHAPKDRFEIIIHYENNAFRVLYYVGQSVASFCLNVFLATGVIPSRQKIIGFEVSSLH